MSNCSSQALPFIYLDCLATSSTTGRPATAQSGTNWITTCHSKSYQVLARCSGWLSFSNSVSVLRHQFLVSKLFWCQTCSTSLILRFANSLFDWCRLVVFWCYHRWSRWSNPHSISSGRFHCNWEHLGYVHDLTKSHHLDSPRSRSARARRHQQFADFVSSQYFAREDRPDCFNSFLSRCSTFRGQGLADEHDELKALLLSLRASCSCFGSLISLCLETQPSSALRNQNWFESPCQNNTNACFSLGTSLGHAAVPYRHHTPHLAFPTWCFVVHSLVSSACLGHWSSSSEPWTLLCSNDFACLLISFVELRSSSRSFAAIWFYLKCSFLASVCRVQLLQGVYFDLAPWWCIVVSGCLRRCRSGFPNANCECCLLIFGLQLSGIIVVPAPKSPGLCPLVVPQRLLHAPWLVDLSFQTSPCPSLK